MAQGGGASTVSIAIDAAKAEPFPHYWERCVGSGHGALTLREDWRRHVAMANADLGIQRVRFHGILDDDMSVSFSPNETGFVNIDSTCDFLVEHNMSMVMELGFMPRWLARNKTGTSPTGGDGPYSCRHSINHYIGCSDPPYDFSLWGDLIGKLGAHLVERYGIDEMADRWAFEVVSAHAPPRLVRASRSRCACACACAVERAWAAPRAERPGGGRGLVGLRRRVLRALRPGGACTEEGQPEAAGGRAGNRWVRRWVHERAGLR